MSLDLEIALDLCALKAAPMINLLKRLFLPKREVLTVRAEVLLIGHFNAYWLTHPSTSSQIQEVLDLIRERISITADEDLASFLDPRLPPIKTAGILDKIVDKVYGGNSTFFFKHLNRER